MSKIRILPDQLANQIAAGEVVERPASVVKELVENSLDAGANHIEVDIDGGGTRLIRVVDNGEGMDEDDVLLCLERHGTSKINSEEDLNAIRTLGFRGEAIPSISSVSKMVITSRRKEHEFGTTLVCHYGSIKKVHESGTQAGTTIEISNLFGNTPARRKFLRTRRTELSHIDDTMRNYGLARPDVAFVFRIDGRETIRLESDADIHSRLATLINYSGKFITIDSSSPADDGIEIFGLLVSPESAAPAASRLRVFVNGRAIRDRMIAHAVNEGMRSFLLKGRSPAGMIKITVPPESIDVNVHPAKHEIRFRDSRIVHTRICDAVRDALVDHQHRVRGEIFSSRPVHDQHRVDREDTRQFPEPDMPSPPENSKSTAVVDQDTGQQYTPASLTTPKTVLSENGPAYLSFAPPQTRTTEPSDTDQVRIEDLMVIGSFKDLYIFCRNRDKLIVIDQHAAHERLLFEELHAQYNRGKIGSQQLMFPITLELSVFQSPLVEDNMEQLENMGFSLREFGGNTWILAAVPALVKSGHPQDLFFDLLEQFGSEKDVSGGNKFIDILATMACKAAVKSGDQLSNLEVRTLLEKMIRADLFSHCPHGRPVVKIMEDSDIKKWFHRT